MEKGIILGDNVQIREPSIPRKLEILMQRCDSLQGQIHGCLIAINDMSAAFQEVALTPQQRKRFIKEVFKIQLRRTAIQSQLALQAGQLGAAQELRKMLDGELKKRAKECGALSCYHKIMRKLERGTLIPGETEGKKSSVIEAVGSIPTPNKK